MTKIESNRCIQLNSSKNPTTQSSSPAILLASISHHRVYRAFSFKWL